MEVNTRLLSGLFITFEGTEGCGKSTQLRLLAERLRASGYGVTTNQEPGGTVIGKEIRRLLLDPAHVEMTPMAELLLMFASRVQAADEVIRPALERVEIVLSDRFTDSSLAYQGVARRLGMDLVRMLHRETLQNLTPDLTLCIDTDVATGLARARQRNRIGEASSDESRIDEQSLAFHQSVRVGYEEIAAAEPERFQFVNGQGNPAVVAERVWKQVEALLHRLQLKR